MDHMSLIHHPLMAAAPVQSTAVNTRGPELCTSVQALNPHYLGYIPRSRIAGFYDKSMHNLLRSLSIFYVTETM